MQIVAGSPPPSLLQAGRAGMGIFYYVSSLRASTIASMPARVIPKRGQSVDTPKGDLKDITTQAPPPSAAGTDGFDARDLMDDAEKAIDKIEMIGEEEAAGLRHGVSQVSPGMRYLHSSRTIHQLVSDRNRAVGIFLAVATLLWTASAAVMNAQDDTHYIIPLSTVKRWCMPFTFGVLTLLAVFVAFLLIRTRIGLIYEVAKMNVLLGLPVGRVRNVSPLSIFFIMQAMISLAGGCSAGLLAAQLLWLTVVPHPAILSTLIGAVVCGALVVLYIVTVKVTTSDLPSK
jgi:hypothetical protein